MAKQGWAVAAFAAFALGCGGTSLNDLSGKVTFAGKPVTKGRIYFTPDAMKKNEGPQGFAEIVDGEYDTRKEGRAPVRGPVLVNVISTTAPDVVFDEYRVPADLAPGASTFDLDIPASSARKKKTPTNERPI